ncbi:MAG: hypothetical protein DMG60_17045 [Acidobacteria bacterium]|nr:MAG: hypothetical protein DMG60_17045 [Acidobacteriota bacterium]
MAELNWKALPKAAREHLYDSVRTREISADDIAKLQEWIALNPEVPGNEDWCKDFGSFKVVGHGSRPATFLRKDQPCWGKRLP